MKISEILAKYDTDKVNGHCYGESYDQLFSKFDRNAPLSILEIGTQKGGSLLAWKEYFPNAKVTGIDIIDVVPDKYRTDTVTRIISDIKEWSTTETFDIIIDDGSHFYEDAMYTVKNLSPKLNEGGVMIVEDVQAPDTWMEGVRAMGIPFTVRDMRSVHGNYDDFLIVIKK